VRKTVIDVTKKPKKGVRKAKIIVNTIDILVWAVRMPKTENSRQLPSMIIRLRVDFEAL